MKIIHTSDWHIGQTLYQYSREEEHKFFFNQLKTIILEENPDALVVSGDIFHTAIPDVISQKLYYHTLVELSRLDNDLQIIVVAGNHDSPSRLEAPRELWVAFNVTVVGNLDFYAEQDENGLPYDASKIQIPVTRDGEIVGWVLAVPFIKTGNYPSLKEDDRISNRVFSFYNNLKENLKQNLQYKQNHSIIATGHFMVNGADLKGQDKVVGGIESVDSKKFSSISDIDYWAFGHIHHPQFIDENRNMRYSGSPFALTFNENYEHYISVVEIDNHVVNVKNIEIKPLIPICDFPFKPSSYENALPLKTVKEKLNKIVDNEIYVRLHIKSELPLSDTENADLLNMFRDKKARYCGNMVYLPEIVDNESVRQIRTLDEFKTISPFDLGCEVYKRKNNNMEMPDEMKEMFRKVCDEIINSND